MQTRRITVRFPQSLELEAGCVQWTQERISCNICALESNDHGGETPLGRVQRDMHVYSSAYVVKCLRMVNE